MTARISPWLETYYGWEFGESGWNGGMDTNLLQFSVLFNGDFDNSVASLPSNPSVGSVYFNTVDKRLYFYNGSYGNSVIPNGFILRRKSDNKFFQFDGSGLIEVLSPTDVTSALQSVQLTFNSLGSAAFQNVEYFATPASLDVVEASLSSDIETVSEGIIATEERFEQELFAAGYEFLGDYTADLNIATRKQYLRRGDRFYAANEGTALPYTTIGTWATDSDNLVLLGDDVLRQELANPAWGAAVIARGVVAVESIADLLLLPENQKRADLRYMVRGYYAGSSAGGGTFYWDSARSGENDGGYVLDGFVREQGILVSPLEFGAGAGGDVTERLRAAHSFANAWGLAVDYSGLTAASIDANADIIVNTDVDFRGCLFSMLNGIVPSPAWGTAENRAFRVRGSALQAVEIDPTSLVRGATRIKTTDGDFLKDGMMYLRSDREVGSRVSAPGTTLYYEQPFYFAGDDATVGVGSDLSGFSVRFASFRPNDKPITIRGLRADKSTYNRQAVVFVERNNVTIELPEFVGASAPDSINQEITFQACGNVSLIGPVSPGNMTGDSSYLVYMHRVACVLFDRVLSTGGTWGVTGTHIVADWTVKKSRLRRIDCHQGLHTLRVSQCTLYEQGVAYGWGTGDLVVADCTVAGAFPVVRCRSDYDGNWEGDINVRDIKYRAAASAYSDGVDIVDLRRTYRGIPVQTARNIIVENVSIDAPHNTLVRPVRFDTPSISNALRAPALIRLKSIELVTGVPRLRLAIGSYAHVAPLGGLMRIHLENIRTIPEVGRANYLLSLGRSSGAHSTYPIEIDVVNCKGVAVYAPANNQTLRVWESSISCLTTNGALTPTNSVVMVSDSRMLDTIVSDELGGTGEIPRGAVVSGLIVESESNLFHAGSLSGVIVRKGIACNLPSGVTFTTALTGWVDPTQFE